MPLLKCPEYLGDQIAAHKEWLYILEKAQELVEEDALNQSQAAKGARINERRLPPEVLGRCYAQYCNLINRMYNAYLNSVHLQRAPYMLEIIAILVKRMYELRDELVHLIVNDYIYVDSALTQLRMTPSDIQIVVPYHFPIECRKDSIEGVLQQMWADAIKRKNKLLKKPKEPKLPSSETRNVFDDADSEGPQQRIEGPSEVDSNSSEDEESIKLSEHTIIPEEFVQATLIQTHERFRHWYIQDFRAKCIKRKTYFVDKGLEASIEMREAAAKLIQRFYREYMKLKRQKLIDNKRDIKLGLLPSRSKPAFNFVEENEKVYARRHNTRLKIEQCYLEEFEKETARLIMLKKDDQIDDITDQIREWFKEWYFGYGFFPEYPYAIEGGTLLVIRGDYPSIEEKREEDEKLLAATKGKTKEQIKQEKAQKRADAKMKLALEKDKQRKEADQIFKARCNPPADPGYKVQVSEIMQQLIETFQRYRSAWSLYDNFPPEKYGETVYGYLKPLITEEVMSQIHRDCRLYVDDLMRLDLKLLISQQEIMYKRMEWKFPKIKARKVPKRISTPKKFEVNSKQLKGLEEVFDLGIISKPTNKISEIWGDLNYAAYELNIQDPDVKYPPPGYGDIRRRLLLSCVFGSGIQPGATRNKAAMLLGPQRNGKSFLVDAVAGEMNAVKIDISPERFSAINDKPAKLLSQVLIAAKVFQPAVIYIKNIERVFYKKVPPEEKELKPTKIKPFLAKMIKQISPDDKIIFIATCTDPFVAVKKPLVSIFNEIILVPRTDYGTLQRYFSEKFNRILSIPLDIAVQPLAQLLQGYGSGVIMEMYDTIMTSERIVRLNVTPLSPAEFLDVLLEKGYEPVTQEEYQAYMNFVIENSPLYAERLQYDIINATRAAIYKKLAKTKAEKKTTA